MAVTHRQFEVLEGGLDRSSADMEREALRDALECLGARLDRLPSHSPLFDYFTGVRDEVRRLAVLYTPVRGFRAAGGRDS